VRRDAAVGIVLATGGYPGSSGAGERIGGLEKARSAGALLFHSGTRRTADGAYETDGGRVLTVVGRGVDVATAREAAERAADHVDFDGMQRRHDIAAADMAATEPVGAAW
jgi:phosphoribosylamine--glycine ligase